MRHRSPAVAAGAASGGGALFRLVLTPPVARLVFVVLCSCRLLEGLSCPFISFSFLPVSLCDLLLAFGVSMI